MEQRLSARLQAVADFVSPGARPADIGTDHGYVPVWLVQTGKTPSALAMDLREGPLGRAREHIESAGLGDRIETRLSDGLAALKPGEADSLVIAGMGGLLLVRILEEGKEKLPGIRELVLQPQSEISGVRKFLRENAWRIADEAMVKEGGKYYAVIRAVPEKGSGSLSSRQGAEDPACCSSSEKEKAEESQPFSESAVGWPGRREMEDAFGPVLLEKKDPVLREWMQRELEIRNQILKNLESSHSRSGAARRRAVLREREMLKLALDETDSGAES